MKSSQADRKEQSMFKFFAAEEKPRSKRACYECKTQEPSQKPDRAVLDRVKLKHLRSDDSVRSFVSVTSSTDLDGGEMHLDCSSF